MSDATKAPHLKATQSNLIEQIQALSSELQERTGAIAKDPKPDAVEAIRLDFLGRKGHLQSLMEALRHCSKEERPAMGKAVNQLKQDAEAKIEGLKTLSLKWSREQKLAGLPLDISLPVPVSAIGSLHPVTLMRRELTREFRRMGFVVWDGPEVDFEFYNFNALNIPEHHPARDMQDTFYLRDSFSSSGSRREEGENRSLHGANEDFPKTSKAGIGEFKEPYNSPLPSDGLSQGERPPLGKLLLRTHTSNTQIHAMLVDRPPLRIVAPGRVYRVDSDPTHTPMFHQIEALVVDRGINLGHLKGVIASFIRAIFGSQTKTRIRPSYFPFVEPGAEIDMMCVHCQGKGCRICKETGWLEVGGAGMIHPNVFEAVELDSEIYTGFAFGFGIDRLAMMKYRVPDLRQLFEGSTNYLGQYPIRL